MVLSSVAGERARRADFIYGSSKAGLDAFTQGLGDALHGTGVHVMVVRPGLVRPEPTPESTPEAVAEAVPAARAASPSPARARGGAALLASARITAARTASARFASAPLEAPSLTTTPDAVAEAIVTGLRRRSETVWVPGSLRAVMSALRHVPRPLYRRLPL